MNGKFDSSMILRRQEEYVAENFIREEVVMLRCKRDAEAGKIFFDYFLLFYELRQGFFFLCHRAAYGARFVLCIEPICTSYTGQVKCSLHLSWCQFSIYLGGGVPLLEVAQALRATVAISIRKGALGSEFRMREQVRGGRVGVSYSA